ALPILLPELPDIVPHEFDFPPEASLRGREVALLPHRQLPQRIQHLVHAERWRVEPVEDLDLRLEELADLVGMLELVATDVLGWLMELPHELLQDCFAPPRLGAGERERLIAE